MAGVDGITGITGIQPVLVEQPGVTLDPSVMGGPYNPAHGQAQWDHPQPYAIQQGLDLSGQAPTFEGSLFGTVPAGLPAGLDPQSYADPTATDSHGAPWPRYDITGAVNSREETAALAAANADLHSIDSGDPAAFVLRPVPHDQGKMPWETSPEYVSSGAPEGTAVGDLTGNNHTGWDRFAGWAVPGQNINRFGYDSAHVTRFTPAAAARVPVPSDDTQGAQRPMVQNIPGRYGSYPIGAGSPFQGQIPGVGNEHYAADIGMGSDYTPPPDPPTNPPLAQQNAIQAPWGWSGLGY